MASGENHHSWEPRGVGEGRRVQGEAEEGPDIWPRVSTTTQLGHSTHIYAGTAFLPLKPCLEFHTHCIHTCRTWICV